MHDVTVSVWNRFHSFPLISGLSSAGFDVMALCTTRSKPACTVAHTCWSSALLTQTSYYVPRFRDHFVNLGVELYHRYSARHALSSRCFWGWSGHHLNAFKAAKRAGIPVILEVGSTHLAWSKSALEPEYKRHGLPWDNAEIRKLTPRVLEEYETADFICVPNKFVAKTFVSNGVPSAKLAVNPYGMDFDFWSARSRRMRNSDKLVVIFAGQFMLRKGAAYLLEAWRSSAPKDAELWIVGPVFDDARTYLDRPPVGVRVLGAKSRLELRELYNRCDVFILPSLEEGMARAALEAMAAGLAVIVTEETGMGEVVRSQQDGWIIPAKSSEAIANALHEAVSDQGRTRTMGDSAQRRVNNLTWDEYGRRAAAFLTTVICPAGPESQAAGS